VLILIPILWLTGAVVCISVCRMAARGDAPSGSKLDLAPLPTYILRTPIEEAPELLLQDTRGTARVALTGRVAR
jgi:hypothetical protein